MDESTRDEITEYVIKELGRHVREQDVIFAVARREGIDYRDAEALVEEIKVTHAERITRRQSPLLVIFAVGTLLGGVALVVFSFVYVFGRGLGQAAALIAVNPGILAYLLTGIGMIAGSIIGLGKIAADLTET